MCERKGRGRKRKKKNGSTTMVTGEEELVIVEAAGEELEAQAEDAELVELALEDEDGTEDTALMDLGRRLMTRRSQNRSVAILRYVKWHSEASQLTRSRTKKHLGRSRRYVTR
jgi:hypothetical protein